MSRPVCVHLLPTLFDPADLRGGVAVVIDVLRASTTICTALAAGAAAICPCRTVEAARAKAGRLPAGTAVLGGERGGVKIDGFDFGNSPADYTAANVGGKTLVFTTTNGTAALDRCRQAERVYIGGFVNLGRILLAAACPEPLHLVCAGTDGVITAEDTLCAGAIAARFSDDDLNDAASLAVAAYREAVRTGSPDRLAEALRRSRGGSNLLALGYGADITAAAASDALPVLPRFHPATGLICCQPAP